MRKALLVGMIGIGLAQAGAIRSTAKVTSKAATATVKVTTKTVVRTSKIVFKAVW